MEAAVLDAKEKLYDTLTNTLESNDLDDVIPTLTYMLADCVAQMTDYRADKKLFAITAATLMEAYMALCVPANITSH